MIQCSDVDVVFSRWRNVRVFMQFSDDYAMFGCWFNVWILLYCLGVGVYALLGR